MVLKVRLVNQYFPPDTSATAEMLAGLASALVGRGHYVDVVCGKPSYGPREQVFGRAERAPDNGALIERVGSTAFTRTRMMGRVANYLSFLGLATVRARARTRPDVLVVGTDPPLSLWAGLLAAEGAPVVYWLQDLHPEAAIAGGVISPGPATGAWQRLHDTALRKADLVVCIGEDMVERVRRKGVQPERVVLIPNGANPAFGDPDFKVVSEIRGGASFVVLHAGNLGMMGAWDTLVEAGRQVNDGVALRFVGEGVLASELRAQGLSVLPFRPVSQLPSVMAAGDLQLVTLRSGAEGTVVPSKLYTILGHGRAVLAVVPGRSEVARVVERWGCGLVADPTDPSDVAAKIVWARHHPDALEVMARHAMKAAEHYLRDRCLTSLVESIEDVAHRAEAR